MRQKKEYRNLNCKLDKEIMENLNTITKETGLTKTAAVENALSLYFDYYKTTGKVATKF